MFSDDDRSCDIANGADTAAYSTQTSRFFDVV